MKTKLKLKVISIFQIHCTIWRLILNLIFFSEIFHGTNIVPDFNNNKLKLQKTNACGREKPHIDISSIEEAIIYSQYTSMQNVFYIVTLF